MVAINFKMVAPREWSYSMLGAPPGGTGFGAGETFRRAGEEKSSAEVFLMVCTAASSFSSVRRLTSQSNARECFVTPHMPGCAVGLRQSAEGCATDCAAEIAWVMV